MTNSNDCDLSQDRLFFLQTGIINRTVCAPASWSADQVAAEVTSKDAPGTSANQWVISDPQERQDDFNGVNHLPCPDCADRVHWLLNC